MARMDEAPAVEDGMVEGHDGAADRAAADRTIEDVTVRIMVFCCGCCCMGANSTGDDQLVLLTSDANMCTVDEGLDFGFWISSARYKRTGGTRKWANHWYKRDR